jgi:hypothetical protein
MRGPSAIEEPPGRSSLPMVVPEAGLGSKGEGESHRKKGRNYDILNH